MRILIYRKAINIEPLDLVACVRSLESLAQTLVDLGDLTSDSKSYDAAELHLEKIESLSAKADYYATGHAVLLARLYQARFDADGNAEDAIKAANVYHRISNSSSNYSPTDKAEAALRYGVLAARLSIANDRRSKDILEELGRTNFGTSKLDDALARPTDLWLPGVSQGLTKAEQLTAIRQGSLLAPANAIAAKVARKSCLQILSVYERGRSILWDRLLNQRMQFESINQQNPDLATRYRELARALETTNQPDLVFKELPRDRYQIEADLGDIVEKIRHEKGFEDFLLPPLSDDQVLEASSQGSIVYLIAGTGSTGGQGLVISVTSTNIVELSQFSDDACRQQYALLKRALECRDQVSEASDILYSVLKWLWYNAAEPILRALGLLHTSAESSKVCSSMSNILPLPLPVYIRLCLLNPPHPMLICI